MTETPNSGSEIQPDGWAAWSRKAGDPLQAPGEEKPASGEKEQGETEEQPPASKS